MNSVPAFLSLSLLLTGALASQDLLPPPAPIAAESRGLPGKKPGTERWLVQFEKRSFDLSEFRRANLARDAAKVARIVPDLEKRVQADQGPFVEAVEKLGGRVVDQWWIVNACAIEIPPAELAKVRALPNVARLEPDVRVEPLILRATSAANHNSDAVNAQGFKGAGVATAIVDTGQDERMAGGSRPHRTYFPDGNLAKQHRLILNKAIGSMPADDVHGHGTGVAGIAAGGNWGASGADNGHAPHANIAGYSIANSRSGGSSAAVIVRAWQTVASDAAQNKIVSANNSYSGSPDPTNTMQQALDSCALNADVLICVACGNFASSTAASQSAANGIAVGATNRDTHLMATFSSRGPLSGDPQRYYPDISANGVSTVMPRRDLESSNYVASGTSMASPQVCGAATLLRSAVTALKADETKAILLASALDISRQNPGKDRNSYGMGLLRDDAALAMARDSAAHGRAQVSSSTKVWTKPVIVAQGKTYRGCVTWMRTTMTSSNWSNLDLEILDGTNVVASSKTLRNLYEVVTFRASRGGAMIMRITATSLDGTSQNFAWAFGEGSGPPVKATYTTYGAGCPSSPQGCTTCVSQNWTKTSSGRTTSASKIAIMEFGQSSPINVCGVNLYCNARSAATNVTISLYDMDPFTSKPRNVLRSATVQIGTTLGVYGVTFAQPVKVNPTDIYFVSFDNADKLTLPEAKTGTQLVHFEFASGQWGTLQLTHMWQYQVRCDLGRLTPVLSSAGAPVIGRTFSVTLAKAPASTAALLFLGFSDQKWGSLPLPLTYTPGCQVLASLDSGAGTQTKADGTSSVAIPVPPDRNLISLSIFNQWLVVDLKANALGIIVSNGGKATFGEL